jgi:tetratricopeptide (TPR) repeat protein
VASESDDRVLRFAALRAGALFAGRYRIVARLGSGGAGEVYRAADETAGTLVALKVLFPGSRPDHALERLRRELRLVRQLTHPGIVRVHDLGEHDGLLYLVMELLEGETLAARLEREGALAAGEAERIGRSVLSALAAAHAAGLVHRDVKPSNVFLAEGGGRVVLLDFGLARGMDDLRLTRTGQMLGTPEYVSPEQARGELVGPATDIYSAGVVIWELLAGRPPFTGDTPMAVYDAHARAPLPRSRRVLKAAPRRLRRLLGWMLEKSPRARPRDAGVALATLDGQHRPLRWRSLLGTRRRRLLVTLAGAVVVALALLFVPVGFRVEQGELLATNAFGGAVATVETPGHVAEAVPVGRLPWPRRYAVSLWRGMDHPPTATPARLGLVDPLSLTFSWRSPPGLAGFRPRHPFGLFSPETAGPQLTRLPGRGGRWRFAAGYDSLGHYPSSLHMFDAELEPVFAFYHPGRLAVPVPVERRDGGQRLLVAGTNNELGLRTILVALDEEMRGISSAPPRFVAPRTDAQPAWYVWTSGVGGRFAEAHGEQVALVGERTIRLDMETGVPLDAADRGGLDVDRWRARHAQLMALLVRGATAAGSDQWVRTARELEHFAAGPGPAAHQGVALARAAELYRKAGHLEEALAAARRAVELEPRLPGHLELLLDLGWRLNGWREARDSVATTRSASLDSGNLRRDLMLGALLSGESDEVDTHLTQIRERLGSNHAHRFGRLLRSLHDGRPHEALEALRDMVDRRLAEFRYLESLALVLREPPDPVAARALLDRHERGHGAGHVVPVVPLEAVLGAMGAGPAPPPAAVEAALVEQERAGREDLMALYYVPWAHALAARAAAEQGDADGWRRHLARARQAPGAGPYVDLLAGAAPRPAKNPPSNETPREEPRPE